MMRSRRCVLPVVRPVRVLRRGFSVAAPIASNAPRLRETELEDALLVVRSRLCLMRSHVPAVQAQLQDALPLPTPVSSDTNVADVAMPPQLAWQILDSMLLVTFVRGLQRAEAQDRIHRSCDKQHMNHLQVPTL